MTTVKGEKIQKVLARAGLGSRREIEKWLEQGLIRVKHQPAKLGDRMLETDHVSVKGRVVKLEKKRERARKTIIYHKPVGEIVSRNDPEGRDTIFKNLPKLKGERWIPVGRLDINTSGLLLLTTDGELAHRLMHPSYELVRMYAVRIVGTVTDEMIDMLLEGIKLEDGIAKFRSVQRVAGGEGANQWFNVSLTEGRTREVRRLWQSFEHLMVSRLVRTQYGMVDLPRDVAARRWRYLPFRLANALAKSVGLEASKEGEDERKGTQSDDGRKKTRQNKGHRRR